MSQTFTAEEIRIADAILYEGYILYPYRPSALKNRQRWSFGGLEPDASLRVSFLIQVPAERAHAAPLIRARLRFLQRVTARGGGREVSWEESIPREIDFVWARANHEADYAFEEPLAPSGAISRTTEPVRGAVRWTVEPIEGRDDVLRGSLAIHHRGEGVIDAAHVLLKVESGTFNSSQDPPRELQHHADACVSEGLWPVLLGPEGSRDTLLATPIILSDHPEIATESPQDLFDATEMDEMLVLRILTLTDDEKREVAAHDPRVRALLERVEALEDKAIARLHGRLTRGDRVRVAPRALNGGALNGGARADAMDLALRNRQATVRTIERDFEGRVHVALTFDDDPGSDLGAEGKPGHRFYFRPDELERLESTPTPTPTPAPTPTPTSTPRLLVVGVGNIFLGDDAFGVEVALRLLRRPQPEGVRVVELGTRGFDVAMQMARHEQVILVDAHARGNTPGTLYVVDFDFGEFASAPAPVSFDAHAAAPDAVLRWLASDASPLAKEDRPRTIRLVGCEPTSFGGDEGQLGLSAAVEGVLDDAVRLVEEQIRALLSPHESLQNEAR